MTAQIIELVTEKSVDEAWEALRRHSAQIVADPRLLCDREFYQEQVRLETKFKRLFMAMEGAK